MSWPPCVILAGGSGTRLRSAVPDLPKCLAPVGRHPFLKLQIESLRAAGLTEFILSLGYLAGKVADYLANNELDGARIRSVVEPVPLGTGGAVRHVLETCGISEAIVTNGDTFISGDLSPMREPLGGDEAVRMGLVHVMDRGRFGGVEVDAAGRVSGFREKGLAGPGLINAGVYRLHARAFSGRDRGPCSLEAEVFPELMDLREVSGLVLPGQFTDIGVPEDYRRFCEIHGA